MSNVLTFIPKDDQALPDWYQITLFYIDGRKEEFKVASHFLRENLLEFVSFEDIWSWVPIQNIKRLEFDKNFSKIIAIKQKKQKEIQEAANKQEEQPV